MHAYIQTVKRRCLTAMQHDLSAAVAMVDRCTTAAVFDVDVCVWHDSLCDRIKNDVQAMILQCKVTVAKCKSSDANRSAKMTEADPYRSLPVTPKLIFLQTENIQHTNEKQISKIPKDITKKARDVKSSSKYDSKSKQYSSMRHVQPSLNDEQESISRATRLEHISKPSKTSIIESSNRLSKVESITKVFDFEVDHVPDPSDRNFNNFLDSELEKIKQAFLEDTASPMQEKPAIHTSQVNPNIRSSSIGKSKRNPSLGKKVSHQKTEPQPATKPSLEQLGYKDKFEELYNRGKNIRHDIDSNRQGNISSSGLMSLSPSMYDDITHATDASKVLSRYSKPLFSANHLQSFTPLFKAE